MEEISASVPLSAIARALNERLPNATSSQLPLLQQLRRNLAARCAHIEKCAMPVVFAPRPVVGRSRAREAEPEAAAGRPSLAERARENAGAFVQRPAFGTFQIIAGSGEEGYEDGPALEASFYFPMGMVKMGDGALVIADGGNCRLRKLQNGVVTTLAGGGDHHGFADGPAATAQFAFPRGLALDAQGRVLVTDFGNRRIRRVTSDGETTTIGGVDGPEMIGDPQDIITSKDGTVFVSTAVSADLLDDVQQRDQHDISSLSADGNWAVLAGGDHHGFVDGHGEAAQFNNPMGIGEGPDGRIYVADYDNHSIRRVDRQGNVTTVAGRPWAEDEEPDSIDGDIAAARFRFPSAVAVASDATIYVAERGGVRQIHQGNVSTLCRLRLHEAQLLLDEAAGLLYVSDLDIRIGTVFVGTLAERREARYYPILRTWALMQEKRAEEIPAAAPESARDARARIVAGKLLRSPIAGGEAGDILVRTLTFCYG